MKTTRFNQVLERMVATRSGVWLVCFTYFLCYVPFIGLTRTLSNDHLELGDTMVGAQVLPIATMASVTVMVLFILASGWWRQAGKRRFGRFEVPWPGRWTALSGLCTAVILTTATMIFSLGVPIVLAMLIMRGGTLVIAPIVDAITGRRVHPTSWMALGLSGAALVVAVKGKVAGDWNLAATICITAYLVAYFVRLQFMSRLAKSDDTNRTKRYFVEEQLVTAPVTLLLLGTAAFIGGAFGVGGFFTEAYNGFTAYWSVGFVLAALGVGLFSQLVGIFGTLIFLNPRENSFATALNRASSTISGVVAALLLAAIFATALPGANEVGGVALVLLAIGVLSQRERFDRWRARAAAVTQEASAAQ